MGLMTATRVEGAVAPRRGRAAAVDVRRSLAVLASPAGLQAARARLGLLQREMAAVLGVDLSALQRWEGGERRVAPSAARLVLAFERDPSLLTLLLRDVRA
jgi:DNA-binding transcriptional regulator YiaG